MITTLLFDLGGTLHDVRSTDESRRRFSEHLIRRLGQYGIVLDKDKLAFLIRKSDMYYDGIMKAAYTDYDTYYAEILHC